MITRNLRYKTSNKYSKPDWVNTDIGDPTLLEMQQAFRECEPTKCGQCKAANICLTRLHTFGVTIVEIVPSKKAP